MIEQLSVRETTVARVFAGRAGRVLAATLFLLAVAMAAPMLARAANPGANINQCRNGTIDAPNQCIDSAWQNGDLGAENSHYREGDSVPFRAVLTNLDASTGNTHTLVIQYDTLQSGKHAYDYLTSFNATEANADPVHDISGATAGNCFPIPVDMTIMFANPDSVQKPGCIQIYNGTITSVAYGTADTTGQRSVLVTFTATDPTAVIAWGGHIATQIDWGVGNSASAINGAPYHMRLLTLDDASLGNQDRSLKASAILPLPAVFTTQAGFGQITLGQSVTDTATLSGDNGPVTGTVNFFVCGPAVSNPNCQSGGSPVGGGAAATIINGQAVSAAFTPAAVGNYCFRAEYTPDQFAPYSPSQHTDTTQECFSVTAQTAINTDAGGPYTVGVDGTVALTDTATLSGGTSDATGTITFTLYDDDACTHSVGTATATVNGADGKNYTSMPAIVVSAAGTYHWIASYVSGDTTKNANTTSACGAPDENPDVNPRPTSLTTNAGGPFVLGSDGTVALNDTAHLSGGTSGAGGTITFMLFSDAACSTQVGGDVTVAVDGADDQDYTSPSITASAPGTYYWVASYSGDDTQNAASSTTCGDVNETPLVIKPHISVSKTPDAQTILIGQTANFTITVTNDGDSALSNVIVTDALAPGCARTSADIPALASMAPGATVTYTCSLANVTSSFTNVAVATGTPPVGPNVTAQDTANVTAVAPATHPAITIVKNPKSQTVTVGNTATFTITVTNTGDVALTNVKVGDTLSPDCTRTIGTLAAGASTSYTCTRANVTSSFTNVAIASGTAGTQTVTAQDTAPVTAKAAALKPKTVIKPKVVSHKKPKATG